MRAGVLGNPIDRDSVVVMERQAGCNYVHPRGRLAAGDAEHDLAVLAPLGHAVERRLGISEREHGVDLRPDCAFVGEPCELDELVAVRLDDEVADAGCLLGDRLYRPNSRAGRQCALANSGIGLTGVP